MIKSNRALGIGLLLVGLSFIAINLYTINYKYFFLPKLLGVGIVSSFLGLAFTVFPGANVDMSNRSKYFKHKWKESKILDRSMWVIFSIAGLAITIWSFIYLDF